MQIVIDIADPPVWTIPDSEVRRVVAALPDDQVVNVRHAAERLAALADADVAFTFKLTPDAVSAARRLKWVHSPSVGVGGVLVPAVVAGEIRITNSRGVHSEAIAEHALALLLALRRRLHAAIRHQASENWAQADLSQTMSPALSATSLLVVGLGTIGSRVASYGAALGMQVTGIRHHIGTPGPSGVHRVLPLTELSRVLPDADAVILALPVTARTRKIIGAAELARMKSSAILINVARGELVDEPALIEAVTCGRIAGAGLDAFETEPLPPGHHFWRTPNVVISPHVASFAGAFWPPLVDLFLENLARYKRARPLLNPVDKLAGY